MLKYFKVVSSAREKLQLIWTEVIFACISDISKFPTITQQEHNNNSIWLSSCNCKLNYSFKINYIAPRPCSEVHDDSKQAHTSTLALKVVIDHSARSSSGCAHAH